MKLMLALIKKEKRMKQIICLALIISLAFSCSPKRVVYNDPIPNHETLQINSKFVNEERTINIWTPKDYAESSDSLPVLYMADGGIKEDFPHIANTVDTLIQQGKIPRIILVGIENTDRKRDLTGLTEVEYDLKYISNPGGADKFRDFMKQELFPIIEKRYRTTKERGIIGESLAGLFVIETFIMDSKMFDSYVAMDPSLWFNEQYLVKTYKNLTSQNDYSNTKLWFAGSSAEDINIYTKKLEQEIENSSNGLTFKYADEPNEKHHTIFRATKEKALIWIFNQK
jgi:predicted alpha/beta superfamily hydrolase